MLSWRSPCGAEEMNPTRNHEVAGLIPGHAQWVKDLALPWAVVQVADVARIWCCCGCDVGWQLQLPFHCKCTSFYNFCCLFYFMFNPLGNLFFCCEGWLKFQFFLFNIIFFPFYWLSSHILPSILKNNTATDKKTQFLLLRESFFFFKDFTYSIWVPRLWVKSELQLPAYATATAALDLNCICKLCSSLAVTLGP